MTQITTPMTNPEPAEVAIAALVQAWSDAWNTHEMTRAANLVMAEVEFVTIGGRWLRGRDEFLAYHRQIHVMQMRDSRWTNRAWTVRLIRDGLMLVHLEWSIRGDRDPDGTSRNPREGLFTWLVGQESGAWRIAVAHNTNLRPNVRHRLSAHDAQACFLQGANR